MSTIFHGANKLDADGRVDDFWMMVDGDTITRTGSGSAPHSPAAERVDVAGKWLVPGFIDLHGHGGGGHSFDGDAHGIRTAVAAHRRHGTTRSVLSLVSNPLPRLHESLSLIAELCAEDPTILGSHLEGPFLSHERKGAHSEEFLLDPSPLDVEALIDASRGTLRHVTMAPELSGALEAIGTFVEAGVLVAIGHSACDLELARRAFDRGASLLTHAFNAMKGIHHRAPGPIVAAFEDDRVTIEIILDGHHVHPDVAHLAFTSAPGRIALITDAMAGAAAADGEYRLGSLVVTVENGLALLSGTDSLAGSTLTQDVALRNAVHHAHVSPQDAVTALTLTPAKALGEDHRLGLLKPGYAADAVILDENLHVQRVWAGGMAVEAGAAV